MIVMMKRKYIQPNTETVNVKLFGSVLEDFGGNPASNHAVEIGARQQSNIFEEDEEEGMYSMWATQKSLFEK
jgi:hypothetical protein